MVNVLNPHKNYHFEEWGETFNIVEGYNKHHLYGHYNVWGLSTSKYSPQDNCLFIPMQK